MDAPGVGPPVALHGLAGSTPLGALSALPHGELGGCGLDRVGMAVETNGLSQRNGFLDHVFSFPDMQTLSTS